MTHFVKYFVVIAGLSCANQVVGYGLPGLDLGFTNILDGGPIRPKPGWYWLQYNQYYTTHRFLNGEGKPLAGVPSPRYRLLDTITEFAYQFKYQLPWNAVPGVAMGLPLVMYSKIGHNEFAFKSSGSGFGNLGFGIYNQWNTIERKERPFFVHRLQFDFSIPVGKNKLPEKNINPSETCFSLDVYWAVTLFLSHRWSLSWRWYYIWSAKNEKINFQAGDAMSINYSLAYEAFPKFYVAAVGYALQQLHNNHRLGVSVPDSKERVFGIGPGAAYFCTQDLVFLSYLYLEAGARNRPQGTSWIFRWVLHF
jgi:hypothetical protein